MSYCLYYCSTVFVFYFISTVSSQNVTNSTEVRFSAVRYLVTKKPFDIDKPSRNIFQWQSIKMPSIETTNDTNVTSTVKPTKKLPQRKHRKGLKRRRKNRKLNRQRLLADQQPAEKLVDENPINLKSLDKIVEKKIKKHKKLKLKNKKKGNDKKKNKQKNKIALKEKNLTAISDKLNETNIMANEINIVKIIPKEQITEQNILKQQIQLNSLSVKNQDQIERNESSILFQKLMRKNFYMICGRKYCDHSCLDKVTSTCGCYRGFRLAKDGIRCMDINECKINNGNCSHACNNMPGSYRCKCPEGFRIGDDGKTCQDINECLLRNGHFQCQDTCRNTYGSYKCGCENLPGTQLNADGRTCDPLDLCSKAGCSHICINTPWKAFCTCPTGYELGSDWKTCKDVNECDDPEISGKCKLGCLNTDGAYKCVNAGEIFQNDDQHRNNSCSKLEQPPHGYIQCYSNREHISKYQTQFSPGTVCHLTCPKNGFTKIGKYKRICVINSKWIGPNGGKCIRTE